MPKKSSDSPTQESNYAIVETSGTQVWLQLNRYYDLDRIKAEVDETITLKNVLLINEEKGQVLGKPYIKGASVELKVLEHRRGPKIIVYKMRPKKKTRRKNGHRQAITRVMVKSISTGTSSPKSTKVSKTTTTAKTAAKKSAPKESSN